jgi:23S rRNA pseudouridine1911/1915/1917 synthase
VLYEDNHLLVIDKPCGLATMGVSSGDDSAVRMAAAYLKSKYRKPGNVYLGVVSRLDAVVSGVLVFARTSKAASRLSEQIRKQSVIKRYLALVEGQTPSEPSDVAGRFIKIEHFLRKCERLQKVLVVESHAPGSQQAILGLRWIRSFGNRSLVEIDLITGRKHQIRVQLSALGYPVLGDVKYGSTCRASSLGWAGGIGLHCHRVTIQHPTRNESLTIRALPRHWASFLQRAGSGWSSFEELVRDVGDQ